jgi:hypothetical protein
MYFTGNLLILCGISLIPGIKLLISGGKHFIPPEKRFQ